MVLSNAEKQRNWRQREREKREAARCATAMMPVAEHESFKAEVLQSIGQRQMRIAELEEQLELLEQITALRGQLAGLEEKLEGGRRQTGPGCPACGGELACPQCLRGQQGYDDF